MNSEVRNPSARIASLFKIKAGEAGLVFMLAGMMFLSTAGSALGGASIDALFFARFGVSTLPYWYVVQGIATFLNLILIAGLVGRVPRSRLYLILPVGLLALLLLGRALLAFNLRWSFPVLYIGKEIINALQGVFLWGLAGSLLEARQAKRLFPLLTAGGIAGALTGSLGTPILVGLFGSENMLLAWGLAMAGAAGLCQALINRHSSALKALSSGSSRGQQAGRSGIAALYDEINQGYRYVKGSSLLRWFSLSSVLFSVLWFSLLLPFSRLSAQQYPDPDRLASFFGLFQGLWTLAALLLSLGLAGRFFNKFGILNALVVYCLIYLGAFAVLAVFPGFGLIVTFRFLQLGWSQGMAETAWQAAYNAVLPGRRDQARAFINAVPGQAGIILAGLILIVGEQALQPPQLFLVGLVAAGLCAWTMWKARKGYADALIESLRSGQPQVFYTEEEPFGGFQSDPAALKVLLSGLSDPDPGIRRLSTEIAGHVPLETVVRPLLDGLRDPHLEVRVACLKALLEASLRQPRHLQGGISEIAACLGDPEPEVRRQAVRTLQSLAASDPAVMAPVHDLQNDPDPGVQAEAALALALGGQGPLALAVLTRLAASPDPDTRRQAFQSLAEANHRTSLDASEVWRILSNGLGDPSPPVRQAALDGLASAPPPAEVESIVQFLADDDSGVRASAASALAKMGEAALPQVLQALEDPVFEAGALQVLEAAPQKAHLQTLVEYITRKTGAAQRVFEWAQFPRVGENGALDLLADSLRRYARDQALLALRAFNLLNNRFAGSLVIEGLRSQDPNQFAFALETIEAAPESQPVRPLLRLWEPENSTLNHSVPPVQAILEHPDGWLRACAAFAAGYQPQPEIHARLVKLAHSDPDPFVSETAQAVLKEGESMQTMATLTTMERILFLRKVPLFENLPPQDLKQVAVIGFERVYSDGEPVVRQGESGDELFIIISGRVRVVTAAGRELAVRNPGDYVGEMAVLSQEPRMASVLALGDVRLLCVGRRDFEVILRQRPEVSLAMMRVLCSRLREQAA